MIKLLIHGCNGAMGQVITKLVTDKDGVEIAAGVDQYQGIENNYPVFSDINDCHIKVDAIIDFAAAPAIDGMLDYAVKTNTPVVQCTTGLTQEQLSKVKTASERVAVLRSANMSFGVNTLFKLLSSISKAMSDANFDIEIVEKHHNQKVDAPSGTALALADAINEAVDGKYEYTFDRSQMREKRKKDEIGFSAVRGGTIVGEHEVIFAGTDEVIEIKHTAYSKAVFAKGAIEAGVFLAGKPAGLYDMSDVVA